MKKFYGRYLFIILAGLLFTFCSDPVKVGDDSPQISISAAWIDENVDVDNDGFSSFANIFFQTSTSEPVNVFFRIGYRAAGTSTYTIYKETAEYTINESETWYVSLGSDDYELPQGYYDFSVEIYYNSELADILTSEDEPDISNFGMEYPVNDLLTITLNNTTYTAMDIMINNDEDSEQSVSPGASATFYFDISGTVNIKAATSGKTSIGTIIGSPIQWDFNHLLTANYETDMVVSSSYFFMRLRNAGAEDFSPIYVNYGLTDQTLDNIIIPNDNVNYNTGYYRAFSNTEVRAYYNDGSGAYVWWTPSSLYSGENNQLVELWWEGEGKQGITENWTNPGQPEIMTAPKFMIQEQPQREYINPHYSIDK